MKLRVGNGCWHACHVQHAALALEAGFFAQEGLDVEVVHAKINPKAIDSSRPDGERYDEVGTVLRDMIAFGIDIIPDVHVRTPFAERASAMTKCASSAAGAISSAARWSRRRESNRLPS